MPSNRLRLGMAGEHYLNTIAENQTKNFVMLDANLSYQISSQCEITCRLSNLLNEKEYAYTTFTNDAMRMSQKYIIRPRSLLIEGYIAF